MTEQLHQTDYLAYVSQGFGVFLGVLAGVAITLLVQWIQQKRNENQQAKNLKFELEFNIRKIDQWLEESARYRDALNGDSLQNYFGYFDFSRLISVTTNSLQQSGLLYKRLDHESIGRLQVIFSEFSVQGERYINNQIDQNKTLFLQAVKDGNWINSKPIVKQNVDYWEKKFQDHKATLQQIVSDLPE